MEMIQEGAHIARHEARRERAIPLAGEYLTWRIGAGEYGVAIEAVQEIRSYEAPTRVPRAPAGVLGVVNLRGVVVPIVDLRVCLGDAKPEYGERTVVIVLALQERVVGVVVDSVSEVLDLAADAIRPPPELAGGDAQEFVTGIATLQERMLMLVDMQRLLGPVLGTVAEAA